MEGFLFCTKQEIIDYLRKFGAGKNSRDTELSEGVRLKHLYEKEFKKLFLIGVPVTQEGLRQVRRGAISKNVALKEFRNDDTDVDVLIIDGADVNTASRNGFGGDAFQMKRLMEYQFNGDFNDSVIKELEKIFGKNYAKAPYLSLYLIINIAPAVYASDWKKIADFCAKSTVPFLRIIVGPVKNEKKEELLIEVFPRLRTVML